MVGELGLGGEIERLEHDAVGVGAVAGEAADDAVVGEVAARQRRAGGDRHAAADDGVGAEMADGEVGDVHRAAAPATIAVVLAEQLADRAVDVLLERRLEQLLAAVGAAVGNARAQLQLRSSARKATVPLARLSPWPRWVLVMLSAMRSAAQAPAAVPSWPTETCVGPR